MMNELSQVVLVNEKDEACGVMEKLEAHRQGVLHRAFSVFIVNENGEMLLQQRAHGKYHSGGLWTNACCSHPLPEEDVEAAAHRRLREEMGMDSSLIKLFDFVYRTAFDNGLIEYEYDHVFLGVYNGVVVPDSTEVNDYRWLSPDLITAWLQREPVIFTSWFHLAYPRVLEHLSHLSTTPRV